MTTTYYPTTLSQVPGGTWHLFVALPGDVADWPRAEFAGEAVPTVARRAAALKSLGYEIADDDEWDWTEDVARDGSVVLMAGATVREIRDQAQDVGPAPQGVGLGLLEPMPYWLTVDGRIHHRGTIVEIRAAVAELVTVQLAIHPVSFAGDARRLNDAFSNGLVEREIAALGRWNAVVATDTPTPIHLQITREG